MVLQAVVAVVVGVCAAQSSKAQCLTLSWKRLSHPARIQNNGRKHMKYMKYMKIYIYIYVYIYLYLYFIR